MSPSKWLFRRDGPLATILLERVAMITIVIKGQIYGSRLIVSYTLYSVEDKIKV